MAAVVVCRYAHKVPFFSEADAVFQVKKMKATSHANKKLVNRLHAYRCPDDAVEHWHIGHDRFKRTKLAYPASIQAVKCL